jgi:hypothetical protein
MRNRPSLFVFIAVALAVLGLAPAPVMADSQTQTFQLVLEAPNVARAPNGDMVSITGSGTFSVQPKSASGSGTFTHTNSQGKVLASGTWTATELLSYQSYGCGVVLGMPIPPNFCGGKLQLRVTLTPTGGTSHEAILWVFCIIGPNPPNSAEEGVRLLVPGIINFNEVVTGENVYIRIS